MRQGIHKLTNLYNQSRNIKELIVCYTHNLQLNSISAAEQKMEDKRSSRLLLSSFEDQIVILRKVQHEP